MVKKNTHIWMWLQNGRIIKAILIIEDGILKIYDENDCLIMKRTGLSKFLLKQIEVNFQKYGAKKLSEQAEPFRIL